MKDIFEFWKRLKVGDTVYYTGLYADCRAPVISKSTAYKIVEDLGDKLKIEADGVSHEVYRCELDYNP